MENASVLRSPIICVLGHVDHGKSSILDAIRGTNIVASEAGAITQAIGASLIPLETIKQKCGNLVTVMKFTFSIPGLLFIDTPGHAAFTTLRKRGGNLADIAILVVDINEGFMPQTLEALDILKAYKTPFIIAANKIDLIPGWKQGEGFLLQRMQAQPKEVQRKFDEKLYELVGKLYELGFQAERFDRVVDYTKQIAIVPCSAKTTEGLPEVLMVLTGLTQKFLENCLACDVKGYAKGTLLEVKEETGLGTTLDVIIYDGSLKVNDVIVIGTLDEPLVTKVRALFEPAPLAEMRDKKSKFITVKKVNAATGVKIAAPELEAAIAGMPLRACSKENLEKVKRDVQREVKEALVTTDQEGIVIKADTLGSIEALVKLLQEKKIPVRKASIGPITKKDIIDAESNFEKDPLTAVVMGFNVPDNAGMRHEYVKVITSDVIYRLLEQFEQWQIEQKKAVEARELETLIRPAKIEFLRGYVFRQNNPAVVGVEVLEGKIKVGTPLMKDGKIITVIKSIQAEKESLTIVEKGKQVAISLPHVTIGRQIFEGDVFYAAIPENDFRQLKRLRQYLSAAEIEIMKEVAEMMRKQNPVWGV
ncbi:translation initiation factor IF-2 [Candidatus Woesearchaeota archaeon]|nr:translation initiation factor IF-2 [Candidatus Woesearchaeota archaeon]